MSWLSKGLQHARLGALNNVVRATHVEPLIRKTGIDHLGTTVWDSVNNQWDRKKLEANGKDLVKYGLAAYGAVSGAEGLAGGSLFSGGAAAAGAGSGAAAGGGALTEFTPAEVAGMGTTTTFPAAGSAAGGTASAPKSSPKGSFIRTALNALKQGGGGQQRPMPMQPPQAPPPDSTALPPPPDASLALRTNLSALQNVQPQQVGGADLRR
jgi:hypothetical protein